MSNTRLMLKALTAEMDFAFRGPMLEIREFPFRIGRESRDRGAVPPEGLDRRRNESARNNDLYLVETGQRLLVSRQHLMLETRPGGLFLVDLFSSCGTIVDGRYVGGDHKGGEVQLHDHDVVVLGTSGSPYLFKVILS